MTFLRREGEGVVDSFAGVWPHTSIKIRQMVRNYLLKISQFQFLARGSVVHIECVGIEQSQLHQIKHCFLRPPICSSGESIVIDHLIKKIYSTHVIDVFADDSGPLQSYFFVYKSSLPLDPPPVQEFLGLGVECRRHDGHQPDVLPADDKGVLLPPVRHLPAAERLR